MSAPRPVEMADLSETESDASSVTGDGSSVDMALKPPSPASREQLAKRIDSLLQENRVLKVELETYKLRVRTLQEENKSLKQASVLIQAKAEQEEEFISNTLLKKIQELKKEKEALALNYEQEEECLTNDLSRKLMQLRNEKAELTATLQQEQESLVNRLMRKIKKLEAETASKQSTLDQLRHEKVELENTLEQEQESLVNRLWKRMDRLEAEKRSLQEKLDQPVSAPPSPMDVSLSGPASAAGAAAAAVGRPSSRLAALPATADPTALANHILMLRSQVVNLKHRLRESENHSSDKMNQLCRDEQSVREENLRLRRRLELEKERRQDLCRHLSESESSLEMDEERYFNELSSHGQIPAPPASASAAVVSVGPLQRARTTSSPNAFPPSGARPVSPAFGGLNVNVSMGSSGGPPSPMLRCTACGSVLPPPVPMASSSAVVLAQSLQRTKSGERAASERFVRPANPPTPKSASPAPSPSGSVTSQPASELGADSARLDHND